MATYSRKGLTHQNCYVVVNLLHKLYVVILLQLIEPKQRFGNLIRHKSCHNSTLGKINGSIGSVIATEVYFGTKCSLAPQCSLFNEHNNENIHYLLDISRIWTFIRNIWY